MSNESPNSITQPPFTEFVLKGTSRCNLQPSRDEQGNYVGGCDYIPTSLSKLTNVHGCYEYADNAWMSLPKWMDPGVTRQAAQRIGEHAKNNRLPHVRVIGHGGEILMATAQWLDEFSTIIESEVAAKSPDTKVQLFVTTNGMPLDQPKADVLKRHGYKVGLSLDGDKVANDRHRRDRHGNSTYDSVVQAAILLRENEMDWGILAVIDVRNDPRTVLNSLASHKPQSISLILPHANHSVHPAADPVKYGHWLNEAFDWYLEQNEEDFIAIPEFDALMHVLLGGASTRETIAGRFSHELFILPNGKYQRVDTIKSTEPGAVAIDMDIYNQSIDTVAYNDPGIKARRMGNRAIAAECAPCPLLKACGGGLYPHRFKALEHRLASNSLTRNFEKAFRNPTIYCAAQKVHIPYVAARLEQSLGAPAGTLLRPARKHIETPKPCPDGYEISRAMVGDEVGMVAVHAASANRAYSDPAVGADPEALQKFLYSDEQNGFYARNLGRWGMLAGNQQPDPEALPSVLVCHDKATKAIVGFAVGRIPHVKPFYLYVRPAEAPTDEIVALYVHPEHWGRGIGAALLSGVMHPMGSVVKLVTSINSAAIGFYEHHGFKSMPWDEGALVWPAMKRGVVLRQVIMSCDSNPYKPDRVGREIYATV